MLNELSPLCSNFNSHFRSPCPFVLETWAKNKKIHSHATSDVESRKGWPGARRLLFRKGFAGAFRTEATVRVSASGVLPLLAAALNPLGNTAESSRAHSCPNKQSSRLRALKVTLKRWTLNSKRRSRGFNRYPNAQVPFLSEFDSLVRHAPLETKIHIS